MEATSQLMVVRSASWFRTWMERYGRPDPAVACGGSSILGNTLELGGMFLLRVLLRWRLIGMAISGSMESECCSACAGEAGRSKWYRTIFRPIPSTAITPAG